MPTITLDRLNALESKRATMTPEQVNALDRAQAARTTINPEYLQQAHAFYQQRDDFNEQDRDAMLHNILSDAVGIQMQGRTVADGLAEFYGVETDPQAAFDRLMQIAGDSERTHEFFTMTDEERRAQSEENLATNHARKQLESTGVYGATAKKLAATPEYQATLKHDPTEEQLNEQIENDFARSFAQSPKLARTWASRRLSPANEKAAWAVAWSKNPEATALFYRDQIESMNPEQRGYFDVMVNGLNPELTEGFWKRTGIAAVSGPKQISAGLAEYFSKSGQGGRLMLSLNDNVVEVFDRISSEFTPEEQKNLWLPDGSVNPEYEKRMTRAARVGSGGGLLGQLIEGKDPVYKTQTAKNKRAEEVADYLNNSREMFRLGQQYRAKEALAREIRAATAPKYADLGGMQETVVDGVSATSYMVSLAAMSAVPYVGGAVSFGSMYAGQQAEWERSLRYDYGVEDQAMIDTLTTGFGLAYASIERLQVKGLDPKLKPYIEKPKFREVFGNILGERALRWIGSSTHYSAQYAKNRAMVAMQETGEEWVQEDIDFALMATFKYMAQADGIDLSAELEKNLSNKIAAAKTMPLVTLAGGGAIQTGRATGKLARGDMQGAIRELAPPEAGANWSDMRLDPDTYAAMQTARTALRDTQGERIPLNDVETWRMHHDSDAWGDLNTGKQYNSIDEWMLENGYNPETDRERFENESRLYDSMLELKRAEIEELQRTVGAYETNPDEISLPLDADPFWGAVDPILEQVAAPMGFDVLKVDTMEEARAVDPRLVDAPDFNGVALTADGKAVLVKEVIEQTAAKKGTSPHAEAYFTAKEEIVGHLAQSVNPDQPSMFASLREALGDDVVQALLPGEYAGLQVGNADMMADELLSQALARIDLRKVDEKREGGSIKERLANWIDDALGTKSTAKMNSDLLLDLVRQAVDFSNQNSTFNQEQENETTNDRTGIKDNTADQRAQPENGGVDVSQQEAPKQKSQRVEENRRRFARQQASADPVRSELRKEYKIRTPKNDDPLYEELYSRSQKEPGIIPRKFFRKTATAGWDQVLEEIHDDYPGLLPDNDPGNFENLAFIFADPIPRIKDIDEAVDGDLKQQVHDEFVQSLNNGIKPPKDLVDEFPRIYAAALERSGVDDSTLTEDDPITASDIIEPAAEDDDFFDDWDDDNPRFSLAPAVESDAFKKWFGDSVVTDANGDPLVVYHGSPNTDFNIFDYDKIGTQGRFEGTGFYFTNDKAVADGYGQDGRVIEAYISMQKPIAVDQPGFTEEELVPILERCAELEHAEALEDDPDASIDDGFLANYGGAYAAAEMIALDETIVDQMGGIVGSGVRPEYVNRAVMEVTGYDGVVSDGFGGEGMAGGTIYVSFTSEQVKSATDNTGQYDSTNPDIRFSLSARQDPRELTVRILAGHIYQGRGADAKGAKAILRGLKADIPKKKELESMINDAKALAAEIMSTGESIISERDLSRFINNAADRAVFRRRLQEIEQRYYEGGAGWMEAQQRHVQQLEAHAELLKRSRQGMDIGEISDALGFNLSEIMNRLDADYEALKQEREERRQQAMEREEQHVEPDEEQAAAASNTEQVEPATVQADPAKEPAAEILWRLADRVAARMHAAGLTRHKNTRAAMRDPWVLEEYRKTLITMLDTAVGDHSYGPARERLRMRVQRLGQYKSFKGLRNAATRILEGAYEARANEDIQAGIDRVLELTKKFSGVMKSRQADVRRAVTARVHQFYKMIRGGKIGRTEYESALLMTPEAVEDEMEQLQTFLEDPEKHAPKHLSDVEVAQLVREKTDRLNVLMRFGALKHKTQAEVADAVDWLENNMAESIEAQEKRRHAMEKEAEGIRAKLLAVLPRRMPGKQSAGAFRDQNSRTQFLELRLKGLTAYGKGEQRRAALKAMDKMAFEFGRRSFRKNAAVAQDNAAFGQALLDIYSDASTARLGEAREQVDRHQASKLLRDLIKMRDDYAQFSKHGRPLSKANLLQIVGMMAQEDYRKIALMQLEIEQAVIDGKGSSQEIAQSLWQHPDDWIKWTSRHGYELNAHQLERLVDSVRGGAELARRLEMVPQIEQVLRVEDMKLLDWFRTYYRENRAELSSENEKITGLPFPVSVDAYYIPAKVDFNRESLGGFSLIMPLVPPGLTPRTFNTRDLDEEASIIELYMRRLEENQNFLHFADLFQQVAPVFNDPKLRRALEDTHGKNFVSQLIEHIRDVLSGTPNKGGGNKAAEYTDRAVNYMAVTRLGFNISLFPRQITSMPAFAMYVDPLKAMKYVSEAGTKEGRETMAMMLNHPYVRARMQQGHTQVERELYEGLGEKGLSFVETYKRLGRIPTKYGDIIPTLLFGQGYYRALLESDDAKAMREDEAKEWAMDRVWSIVEMSQQSGLLINLAEWQRHGGSMGRALGQFISTPQQFWAKQTYDFRDLRASIEVDGWGAARTAKAGRQLAKTVALNHLVLPLLYNGMKLLYETLLGDEPDKDDLQDLFISMLTGPFAGIFLLGSAIEETIRILATGEKNYFGGTLPLEGAFDDAYYATEAARHLLTGEPAEMLEAIDRMLKGLQPLYRDARKAVENYSE